MYRMYGMGSCFRYTCISFGNIFCKTIGFFLLELLTGGGEDNVIQPRDIFATLSNNYNNDNVINMK